ncbi:MAG: RNA 2',3'-cyclic phosphodiesterase [Anaerolineae bacterium]|nr:RNA 2',3'-cyclic phosphodiesterase [Anaerolineae bacterium]
MPDPLRLFIALELPPAVRDALAAAQDQLQPQVPPRAVRWTQPEGIHLTLKFLGDTPAARVDSIGAALVEAVTGHAALALRAGTLGCFPNTERPRVLWIGLSGDLDRLSVLQAAVERALGPLGFPRENRPFSPHLTLGRVRREASRQDVQALGALVARSRVGTVATWTADAVSLMQSDLHPDGARYTCLRRVPLG